MILSCLRTVLLTALFSRLRVGLVLLVLFAVVPAFGVMSYTAFEHRQLAIVEAQEDALRLARIASTDQDRLVEETHRFLANMIEYPQVLSVDVGTCRVALADLLEQHPLYTNLGVINPNGDISCSAVPIIGPANVADQVYFRHALQQHDFATIDFQVGRTSGGVTLSFGRSILNEAGELQAVVFATLDFFWLDELAAHVKLPPGSNLGMIDQDGTILAQYPDSERWVGRSVSDVPIVETILMQGEGTIEGRGPDGVSRLFAFSPMHGTLQGTPVYVWGSIPKEAALADANRILKRNLASLGLLGVLALLAAWVGADVFVLRRVNALVQTTRRLSAGDRSARTGMTYPPDELAHLAGAFDEMAESLQRHDERTQSLARAGSTLNRELQPEAVFDAVCQEALLIFRADAASVVLFDAAEGRARVVASRGLTAEYVSSDIIPMMTDCIQLSRDASVAIIGDLASTVPQRAEEIRREGLKSALCASMFHEADPLGALVVYGRETGVTFGADDQATATVFAEQAAIAITRARLYAKGLHQLDTLRSLRDIDVAIASSLDLRHTLSLFLEKVIAVLRVDAADVLLLDPDKQTLKYAAGRGFRRSAMANRRVHLGDGLAGRAAQELRSLSTCDLSALATTGVQAWLLWDEGLLSYCVVPLVAKGQLEGVLEIFHRARFEPPSEWFDTAQLLAGQAAIAIDNAVLFDDLQRSHADLARAYDTTLEGWSRALDLRDEETEGHTLRVTRMTLDLAHDLGVSQDQLVHMRRGALLHDIGKIGIPDSILLKPGPLTEEEWEIMRRHPVYAYELLWPIEYLRPALDIPYCHHEKWDGTGYPRGLGGEQIPLAARIFAVVDVWDALRSDRPYRLAWSEDKVREHIRSLKGAHFDAKVVDVFLQGRYLCHSGPSRSKQRMVDPGKRQTTLHP
ncbi:MAG: GAF domain-containing protein [Chloroflexota bacterium]|nr:MAG: GAF domain-containing protein [Chloroflexota bacterium]